MREHEGERDAAKAAPLDGEREAGGVVVGERRFGPRMVQRMMQRRAAARAPTNANVKAAAQLGTSGAGGKLPHFEAVQRSFGRHDLSELKAHTDGAAASGADAM